MFMSGLEGLSSYDHKQQWHLACASNACMHLIDDMQGTFQGLKHETSKGTRSVMLEPQGIEFQACSLTT